MLGSPNKMARPYSNEFDGKVFNSGFKEYDFNGFVGVNRAWGYSQLSFSSFNQSLGLVEGERNENGEFEYAHNNEWGGRSIDSNGVRPQLVPALYSKSNN